MINLDFADVETVMSSSGKAMMGTGEAEGDNRAMAATELALNNPLIDEYTLTRCERTISEYYWWK